MIVSSHARAKFAGLFTILILSAGTMLWLFWRFPLITALGTLAVLTLLGVSARLARLVDTDLRELAQGSELERGSHGA
jgi:hypothetical protein